MKENESKTWSREGNSCITATFETVNLNLASFTLESLYFSVLKILSTFLCYFWKWKIFSNGNMYWATYFSVMLISLMEFIICVLFLMKNILFMFVIAWRIQINDPFLCGKKKWGLEHFISKFSNSRMFCICILLTSLFTLGITQNWKKATPFLPSFFSSFCGGGKIIFHLS